MLLYVGLVAPVIYPQDIIPGISGLDLSTVTVATFEIRKPNGTTTSWTTSLTNQTATTLTMTHSLSAAPSEIDQEGQWRFYAKFTVPGGFERSDYWYEYVHPEHGP